jgi:hypothetical protein
MLFFILTLILLARAQTFCLCTQEFVYDPNDDCLKSGDYDVENRCFRCPVTNSSGTFNFCGSMVYLGYGGCGQTGAQAARAAACTAIGGNTGAGSYACFDSAGANKSQTTSCVSNAPISTLAPTSASSFSPLNSLLLFVIAFFV